MEEFLEQVQGVREGGSARPEQVTGPVMMRQVTGPVTTRSLWMGVNLLGVGR